MTDEEINITIAEHLGWEILDARSVKRPDEFKIYEIPDYANDLNAIRSVVLSLSQNQFNSFICSVISICGSWEGAICSSAKEQSQAFLVAVGKWKE